MPTFSLFDALRRLPVVIGCVVLATAQPMSGNPAPEPDRSSETLIYPKGSAGAQSSGGAARDLGYGNPFYLTFAILAASAGAWILWRRRTGAPLLPGSVAKKGAKLDIEETRSLGNRQYLVVAAYEGRKFLLGVTTDRIELLTHLPSEEDGSDAA